MRERIKIESELEQANEESVYVHRRSIRDKDERKEQKQTTLIGYVKKRRSRDFSLYFTLLCSTSRGRGK